MKGFTQLHPHVRDDLRGTYAGLASERRDRPLPRARRHRGRAAADPPHRRRAVPARRGLTNYWGYSSIGYLAPHALYAATGTRGEQVLEFKGMVKALHRAGIEVILDVVYNHTAEGNHLGPMLAFKGIDNESYYRLMPDAPRFYQDFTGTGNSLNPVHPSVLRLIMDSLRYFVIECHVDGFRFDLASALAREFYEVDRLSTFFDTIHQDPVISQVKLIAEPWDVGPAATRSATSRCCGRSGTARTATRCATSGAAAATSAGSPRASPARATSTRPTGATRSHRSTSSPRTTASRCATSSRTTRSTTTRTAKAAATAPTTTARGTTASRATTDDTEISALRARQQRNFLATLLLSQGIPMLLGGDELGRTQHGNNNAWCQDNEISWFDWEHADAELLAFVRDLIRLRRDHPVFRRETFLSGTRRAARACRTCGGSARTAAG